MVCSGIGLSSLCYRRRAEYVVFSQVFPTRYLAQLQCIFSHVVSTLAYRAKTAGYIGLICVGVCLWYSAADTLSVNIDYEGAWTVGSGLKIKVRQSLICRVP